MERVVDLDIFEMGDGTRHDLMTLFDFTGLSNIVQRTLPPEYSSAAAEYNGTAEPNLLPSTTGDDVLASREGGDFLFGGSGDDMLLAAFSGDDYANGGAGTDVITFVGSEEAVTVDLASGTATGGTNDRIVLSGFEVVLGGRGADTLIGNRLGNTLEGGGGDDTLAGGAGPDWLIGGSGSDTASYEDSAAGVAVDLSFGYGLGGDAQGDQLVGIENLIGSGFADQLTGNASANLLDGGAGNDIVTGGLGDTLIGGSGDDTFVIDGAVAIIVESATEGFETVESSINFVLGEHIEALLLTGFGLISGTGNAGANVLTGNGNANVLVGLDGSDTLQGQAGSDTLVGGTGDDSLSGGLDSDIFVFDSAFGADVIEDFAAGAGTDDRIEFAQAVFADFGTVIAACSQEGSDVVVTANAENTIILRNVELSSLHADDFRFI